MSAVEFANEPFEAIQAVRTIWSLQDERDKLESRKADTGNGSVNSQ